MLPPTTHRARPCAEPKGPGSNAVARPLAGAERRIEACYPTANRFYLVVGPVAVLKKHPFPDGHYLVTLPALRTPRCANCGAIVLDDGANEQIDRAFRQQLKLLTPEDIRARRKTLG